MFRVQLREVSGDDEAAATAAGIECVRELSAFMIPTLLSERSCTPLMQSSSISDDDCDDADITGNNCDCTEDDIQDEEDCKLEETTCFGDTLGKFLSEFIENILASARDVSDVLGCDRREDEAVKKWKDAKRDLEEAYAEIDRSGNEKFETTTFFEKSKMYKENATKMEQLSSATKRSSKKKQKSDLIRVQERSLRKMLLTVSLSEVEDV